MAIEGGAGSVVGECGRVSVVGEHAGRELRVSVVR